MSLPIFKSLAIALIFCMLPHHLITAQTPPSKVNGTDIDLNPIDTPAGSVKPCQSSSDIGQFIGLSPNMSRTWFLIGQDLNFTWTYSINARPPRQVTISYKRQTESIKEWKVLANNFTGNTYIWKTPINGLIPGSYIFKYVGDGKDATIQQQVGDAPLCFDKGDVTTAITKPFKLFENNYNLEVIEDPFPPNSNAAFVAARNGWGSVIVLASTLVLMYAV